MCYKLRLFIISILLTMGLVTVQSLAVAEILEKSVLVVAGDENFPPYEFIDEINDVKVYRGFNVDLLQAVALSTGYEIQFRPMRWADALEALDRGEVDAVGGMKYNRERQKIYDFSEAYMTNSLAIFVRKDMQAIATIDDLTGKKVAVQKNDIGYQRLKNKPIELVLTQNQEDALNLLLNCQVDAAFGNKLAGQYVLQRTKKLDEVKTVGGVIDPEGYCVAVKKGNAVLAVFNKGLQEIKRNGTYDKLYAKWFGEPVDYPAQYYKRNYRMALIAVILLFVIAVIIVQINLFLRREVKKRVCEIQTVNDELRKKNLYIERAHKYQEKMLNSGYSGIVTLGQNGCIKFANCYADRYLSADPTTPLAGRDYRDTSLRKIIKGGLLSETTVKYTGEAVLGPACIEYTIDVLEVYDEKDIIIYLRDITQEKCLQEELTRKDKLEALGKLVACIAHEIRTPLTSIKTFVELLPIKYDNPVFRKKISEFVPQEIERLNGIVTDLLTYAHPRKISRERILLKKLIDGIMVFFADTISKQNIELEINIEDEKYVYVDIQQIKQVIINVILNALQALVEKESPRLIIIGTEKDSSICLIVKDNGVGIQRDNLKHIFEPFFSTKSRGTGLGLFVSYQLAKQNGVSIVVESEEDVGTTVSLKFINSSREADMDV